MHRIFRIKAYEA
jgi:hypothetical protein